MVFYSPSAATAAAAAASIHSIHGLFYVALIGLCATCVHGFGFVCVCVILALSCVWLNSYFNRRLLSLRVCVCVCGKMVFACDSVAPVRD